MTPGTRASYGTTRCVLTPTGRATCSTYLVLFQGRSLTTAFRDDAVEVDRSSGGESGLHPCPDLLDANNGAVLPAKARDGRDGQVPVRVRVLHEVQEHGIQLFPVGDERGGRRLCGRQLQPQALLSEPGSGDVGKLLWSIGQNAAQAPQCQIEPGDVDFSGAIP